MGIFDLDSLDDDATTITDLNVEVNQDDVLARIQDHALDVVLLQEHQRCREVYLGSERDRPDV